ncbi:hypothetical protein C0992_003318 [Termitomyces sp. T32_za158]|nr:hypothetical protein C0992_003318 [Termitomyces sp. T32_za158]
MFPRMIQSLPLWNPRFRFLTSNSYLNFVPQPKKSRFKKVSPSSVPSTSGPAATAGSGGSYQEEWIPEHHLKKTKKSSGVAASGEELSGSELSGTEGRKRKGKK